MGAGFKIMALARRNHATLADRDALALALNFQLKLALQA